MNGNQFIGMRVSEFQRYNDIGPIMGVAVIVDEEHEYQYPLRDTLQPNDYVLEVTCPYGSQAMAQTIYNSIHGKVYKGFSAQNAPLPIDAELGDAVTVKDTYSMLAYQSLEFGPGHMSEVAAPGDNELENEYPWLTSTRKEFDRVLATTRSWITKTSDQIMLKVEDEINEVNSSLTVNINNVETRVTDQINGINNKFTVGLNGIEARVTSAEGSIQTTMSAVNGIEARVTNAEGEITATLNTIDGFTISDSSGTTKIKGSSIDVSTLNVDDINFSGAIRWQDLSDNNAKKKISNMTDSLYDMATEIDSDGRVTYISGNYLETGTVVADNIRGAKIYIMDNTDYDVGVITTRATTSYRGQAIELESYDSLSFVANENIDITNGSCGQLFSGNVITFRGNGIGAAGGRASCGTSDYPWSVVYAQTGEIDTSDRNEKTEIEYGLEKYDKLFDSLKPCTFRFKDRVRTHQGMIAQDVEDEINALGIDSQNFAAFIKFNKQDENGENIEDEYGYALRYTEFIPTLIWQVQQLKKRVNELERMIPQ